MSKLFYMICFLISLFNNNLSNAQIHFEKEKIRINVSDNYCIVTGTYYFKNYSNQAVKKVILYPIRINENQSYPYHLEVFNCLNHEPIQFKKLKKSILFTIELPAYALLCYEIEFHQAISKHKFEYILETSTYWEKPIISADFLISLPHDLQLTNLSLEVDSTFTTENSKFYYIHEDNLKTKKNLLLEWSE